MAAAQALPKLSPPLPGPSTPAEHAQVIRRTRYERIAGFRGLRNVEAIVRRSNGRLVASSVEISGGRSDDD